MVESEAALSQWSDVVCCSFLSVSHR